MAKDMQKKRKERKEQNNNKEIDNKKNINWYPGHMAKTKRLIKEQLDLIDIVYEVIDARIPSSSKIIDLDEYIKNKPRLLIMTKKDLCDLTETNKWVKHYESLGYKVLLMDLENNFKSNEIINATMEILEEFNKKRESKDMLIRKARVLVVGIPNCGKSTLINRLSGKKVVNTGNKPGVTKDLSWIRVNDSIELLDTPGILWPKIDVGNTAYNLASLTAIKQEVLPLYDIVEYILNTLAKYYPENLKERYNLDEVDDDIILTLDKIAKRRGCLLKGGEVDYDKVINIVINDVKSGFIKNITFDRYE